MRYAYYFKFPDEAAAIVVLAEWRVPLTDAEGTEWSTSEGACVDAPIPVLASPGALEEGYHANLLLHERRLDLEQLPGWLSTMNADTRELLAGTQPANPTRVFA